MSAVRSTDAVAQAMAGQLTAGDKDACEQALADAERALGPDWR